MRSDGSHPLWAGPTALIGSKKKRPHGSANHISVQVKDIHQSPFSPAVFHPRVHKLFTHHSPTYFSYPSVHQRSVHLHVHPSSRASSSPSSTRLLLQLHQLSIHPPAIVQPVHLSLIRAANPDGLVTHTASTSRRDAEFASSICDFFFLLVRRLKLRRFTS